MRVNFILANAYRELPHSARRCRDLSLETALDRARAQDIPDRQLEYQPARDTTNRVRIVRSIPMAYFLIAELRRQAIELQPSPRRPTIVALGLGVAAPYAGIDDARHGR